MNIQSVLVIHF